MKFASGVKDFEGFLGSKSCRFSPLEHSKVQIRLADKCSLLVVFKRVKEF